MANEWEYFTRRNYLVPKPVENVPTGSGYIKDNTGRVLSIDTNQVVPNSVQIVKNVAPRNSGYITDNTGRKLTYNNGVVTTEGYSFNPTNFWENRNIPEVVPVDNTPVHNFIAGEDVSKYYRYNPKTSQASREGYQQYVDTVNSWDKQKATPEQQYVDNFINSYDQYQRIRNGYR